MELFKLLGTIAIDTADMDKAFKRVREDGGQAEKNLKGTFSKMGGAAVAFGKTVATGVAAGATAVAGLIGSSVKAFADYEQLAGGTKLLFGEAYDYIIEKSKNAYKDVQMSQNDYLEQVNGFATGLKTSLGGNEQAAAELADRIVTAEADIVAATGNTQENVQNAFNGIMKSNFTMLDNLQLGITPTKEGFQEVINKVNEWNTANGEATDYQIENLADCQSALLDYIEMQGMSGYASAEAAETISGSIAMTKGAWENLVSGLAQDNADIPALVSNVVTSGAKVIENIIPVAKQVLKSIPAAISEISPEAGAAFQKIVDIGSTAIQGLKSVIEPTVDLVSRIFNYVKDNTWVLTATATAIGIITTAITLYNTVSAIKAAMAAAEVTTIWGLVAAYAAQAVAMAAAIAPYLLIAAAIAAVIAIGVALYKNWDKIKEKCAEFVGDLKGKFSEMKENASEKFEAMKKAATEKFEDMKKAASEKIQSMKQSASEKFESMKKSMGTIMQAAKDTVSEKLTNMKSAYEKHGGGIKGVASAAMEGVKGYYSAGFTFIDKLTGGKLSSVANQFTSKMEQAKLAVSNKFSSIKNSFTNGLSSAYDTVSSKLGNIKDKFSDIMEGAKNIVSNAIEKIKGAFNFSWSLPHLKLPHISVSGGEAPFGIGGKGSLPHFSVEWYKKAYDNAMLLKNPTIFGYSSESGKFLGGGDGNGSEVVAGSNTLMSMISAAVADQNVGLSEVLYRILEAILALDENMGGNLREALAGTSFEINKREFARLVKAVN